MFWDIFLKFIEIIVPVGLVLLIYYLIIQRQKKAEEEENPDEQDESTEFDEYNF